MTNEFTLQSLLALHVLNVSFRTHEKIIIIKTGNHCNYSTQVFHIGSIVLQRKTVMEREFVTRMTIPTGHFAQVTYI